MPKDYCVSCKDKIDPTNLIRYERIGNYCEECDSKSAHEGKVNYQGKFKKKELKELINTQ